MTIEEAIEILKSYRDWCKNPINKHDKDYEAFDMAINLLEQKAAIAKIAQEMVEDIKKGGR